jgi:hypothetical protein
VYNKIKHTQYKDFIVFLKNNKFSYKKEKETLCYKKLNIIVKIDSSKVDIDILSESRCYSFPNETTSDLLIKFVEYCNTILQPA